ncbi:MAG: metal-dependent hydrolase [Gemmatimonadota bacterium]|nr:metal-dependent hydrolase [Gemmatimonadota bacterium]
MYVGHLGAALGGKRLAPSVALATLVFATYLPDWVDASLCLTGRYHDAQMYSHSIPAMIVLAIFAGATQLRNAKRSAALVVAAVVISHVLLDYLTGIKPTWPGGPLIGLGMYRFPIADFALEAAVIVAGWLMYRGTVQAERGGWNSPTVMLGTLLLMQAGVDAARLLSPSMTKC